MTDHEQAKRLAERILAEDYIAERFAQPLARAYLNLAAQLAERERALQRIATSPPADTEDVTSVEYWYAQAIYCRKVAHAAIHSDKEAQ